MSFHEYSKQIVEEYLGTVAYVDDLIFSEREPEEEKFAGIDIREVSAEMKSSKTEANIPVKQRIPNINPFEFTNGFLEKGIHCALFEIKNDTDSLDSLKKTLKKTDVIILDWQMHQDLGRKATDLLLSVLQETDNHELRLFIIFTNDRNYKELLNETIIPELTKIGIEKIDKVSDCIVKFGHFKIVVLAKENGNKSLTTISDKELPNKVIEEFTDITEGLVSNTALKAISVIRRNSHSLLGVFNKDLDSAFLAHRAMLPIPEDAELLVKDTIVDSINSIVSYSNIHETCSQQRIEDWIDASTIKQKDIDLGTGKNIITITLKKTELKKWQEKGYKNFFYSIVSTQITGKSLTEQEFNSFEKFKLKVKATECFSIDDIIIKGRNEDFAILTHQKSNLKSIPYIPYLTLGVVIQLKDRANYYLCIQQRCDSIRIQQDEIRNFLFLPLNEKGCFPIVIKKEDGDYINLKININNCHNLQIKQFKQTQNGAVQAKKEINDYYFEDINGIKFKWILDLKESHAQRIANNFAAQLSRVGLDESEWLRRS